MNFRRTTGDFKPASTSGTSLAGWRVTALLVCLLFAVLYCGVEQLAARESHKLEVVGASPAPATNFAGAHGKPFLPNTPGASNGAGENLRTVGCGVTVGLLDAMERIESNGVLAALGDHGRSSGPLQISRRAWADCNSYRRRSTLTVMPYAAAFDRDTARQFAAEYMQIQAGQFRATTHRWPTNPERVAMYQLGFCGFRRRGFDINKCPASVRAAIEKL